MNSRPLTYVTEDPLDLIPLTPGMFLQDNVGSHFPEIDCLDAGGLRKQYNGLVQLRKEIRSRFRTEYLGNLLQRSKEKRFIGLKVGDVVLVGSDNMKRLEWPMALITELVPGRDGIPRVAWIRTAAGGVMTRPIQRLFQLEVGEGMQVPEKVTETARAEARSQEEDKLVVTRTGRTIKIPKRFQD